MCIDMSTDVCGPNLSNMSAVIGAKLSWHHVVHTCLYVLYVSWEGPTLSNMSVVIGAELSGQHVVHTCPYVLDVS